MSRVMGWVGVIALGLSGACDAISSPAPDSSAGSDGGSRCAATVCPEGIACPEGEVLAVLEGACCPSCQTAPVDAGQGCLCSPERDSVCGDDLVAYQNACFAHCAGVDVLVEGGCPSRAQFPPGNYGEACESDEGCDAPYECLPAAHGGALDPLRTTCSVRCETVDECPPVVSDHCGDQTLCMDGICGFWLCA